MKLSRHIAFLLAALAVLSATRVSSAADASSSAPSISPLSNEDVSYDFEVYWGEPRFGWFIVWEFGDGSTMEEGPFSSHYEASYWVVKLYNYDLQPEGSVGYEMVERELDPIMEYLVTVDTRAEAEMLAGILEGWGFYAEVRRVSIFEYMLSR